MKKIIINGFCVVTFILMPFLSLAAEGQTTPPPILKTYEIDPTHTYVLWHIDHFGFSKPSGKWMAEGTIGFDKNQLKNSNVNVTINTTDITTGITRLDDHIKSKEFLDVVQFPKATFVSTSIESTDNQTAKVNGNLTVHGVTKSVTLDVIINKSEPSPLTQKQTIGFSGFTKLKRSDFGINAYLPGLSDDVDIEIQGEAVAKEEK